MEDDADMRPPVSSVSQSLAAYRGDVYALAQFAPLYVPLPTHTQTHPTHLQAPLPEYSRPVEHEPGAYLHTPLQYQPYLALPPAEIPPEYLFTAADLARYDLPEWGVLNEVLEFYYKFCQPNQQILPRKRIFLQRLALNHSASVIHAIIATVCHRANWPFENSETVWVERMYKYWDTLDEIGMLLCYSLARQTMAVKKHPEQAMQIRNRVYDLIHANRYHETLWRPCNHSSRMRTDIEATVRMVWIYWVESNFLRIIQGRPYGHINSSASYGAALLSLMALFPLPVSNVAFANSLEETRLTWDDVARGIYVDAVTVVKAGFILEETLDIIAAGAERLRLVEDLVLEDYLRSHVYYLRDDVVVLNCSTHISSFMVYCLKTIHQCAILCDVLAFDALMGRVADRKLDVERFLAGLDTGALSSHIPTQVLLQRLAVLDQYAWECLLQLVDSVVALVDLISLYLGRVPEAPGKLFSVLYGVTSTDSSAEWYENEDLITNGDTTCLKASDFSVKLACLLICILPSLVLLSMAVRAEDTEDPDVVQMLVQGSTQGPTQGPTQGLEATQGSAQAAAQPTRPAARVRMSVRARGRFHRALLLLDYDRVGLFLRFRAARDSGRGLDQDIIVNIIRVEKMMSLLMADMDKLLT